MDVRTSRCCILRDRNVCPERVAVVGYSVQNAQQMVVGSIIIVAWYRRCLWKVWASVRLVSKSVFMRREVTIATLWRASRHTGRVVRAATVEGHGVFSGDHWDCRGLQTGRASGQYREDS